MRDIQNNGNVPAHSTIPPGASMNYEVVAGSTHFVFTFIHRRNFARNLKRMENYQVHIRIKREKFLFRYHFLFRVYSIGND